jgi:hypothetical protein
MHLRAGAGRYGHRNREEIRKGSAGPDEEGREMAEKRITPMDPETKPAAEGSDKAAARVSRKVARKVTRKVTRRVSRKHMQ